MSEASPLRILIAALGGEGGGVLMNWIVAAARRAGLDVQATSVPGVAQRTGATSYYIEIATEKSERGNAVYALMPMPGRVDVVVASELVEAARMLERGFVSPRLTTLIASSNRVYATAEKIEMGDGRFDVERIEAAARELTKELHVLDLAGLAREHGTLISATMFGALAGSGVLPWPREISQSVIGDGRSAAASKAGFDAAFAAVGEGRPGGEAGVAADIQAGAGDGEAAAALPDAYAEGWSSTELQDVVRHGFARAVDYQDEAYGELYLERVKRLEEAAAADDPRVAHGLVEAARRLALWMTYEDIARVADLKTRPERFARIAREAEIEPGQLFHVTEYLKPGAAEIAASLPVKLGRRMMRRIERGGSFPFLGRGIRLRSNGIFGFYLLRGMASLKGWRRGSLRYLEEQAAIERWLEAMVTALARAPAFAAALGELPRVLKGYSDTQERGQRAYGKIMDGIVRPALDAGTEDEAAAMLRQAIAAALADPEHAALDELIDAGMSGQPRGAAVQPSEATVGAGADAG